MATDAVLVEAVSRQFGVITAVHNLSFSVQQGEIFGLLGPNGAGKTTMINMITGILRRQCGKIEVLGVDPEQNPREVRRRIGLAPQQTNVYADLSGIDNLWHHAALYCDDVAGAGERIELLLTMMSLWERRKDAVRTYSGGMQRRLVLARALLHDPDIVFFDEPTLGVDVQGKHVLWEHIAAQQEAGKTFIVSTNDMAEADELCDRLVIIDHGQAIKIDSPENLKSNLNRDVVIVRTSPAIADPQALLADLGVEMRISAQADDLRLEVADAEKIAGDLVSRITAEHRLESLRIARPTLDDVFLHYTGRALRE